MHIVLAFLVFLATNLHDLWCLRLPSIMTCRALHYSAWRGHSQTAR